MSSDAVKPVDASEGDLHAEHEVFDGEPVTELAADEPPTPLWMPLIGATLLLVGAGWWLIGVDEVASDAKGTASAVPAPVGSAPRLGRPTPPKPRAKMTREQLEDLRKRALERRAAQPGGQPGVRPVPAPASKPAPAPRR